VTNSETNVFVTGGTGFIGGRLTSYLLSKGFRVTATGSSRQDCRSIPDRYAYIRADTTEAGDWQDALARSDVIINLAGKTIFGRWTSKEKKAIADSRILTTRRLVEKLDGGRNRVAAMGRPAVLTTPSLIVRLVLGEFGESLVTGQCVVPEVLMANRFSFRYPDLQPALSDILSRPE